MNQEEKTAQLSEELIDWLCDRDLTVEQSLDVLGITAINFLVHSKNREQQTAEWCERLTDTMKAAAISLKLDRK